MNFYKHHLGDYIAHTSHLSWDEDCAYRRLLDAYYKREAPIPLGIKDACRVARATTPLRKAAVETVLREFFVLESDGWHQKRCDEEIEAANAQAQTNRRIAQQREHRRREQTDHESFTSPPKKQKTNRSPDYMVEREPSQTPDTRLQTPDSISQTPDSMKGGKPSPPSTPSAAAKASEVSTASTWEAYAATMKLRYHADPVRNASVNSKLKTFVKRVGQGEAPQIAAFYVRTNHGLYVSARHCVDLLLRDAESLALDWKRGVTVTQTEARQKDRTQTNFNAFTPLIEKAEAQRSGKVVDADS